MPHVAITPIVAARLRNGAPAFAGQLSSGLEILICPPGKATRGGRSQAERIMAVPRTAVLWVYDPSIPAGARRPKDTSPWTAAGGTPERMCLPDDVLPQSSVLATTFAGRRAVSAEAAFLIFGARSSPESRRLALTALGVEFCDLPYVDALVRHVDNLPGPTRLRIDAVLDALRERSSDPEVWAKNVYEQTGPPAHLEQLRGEHPDLSKHFWRLALIAAGAEPLDRYAWKAHQHVLDAGVVTETPMPMVDSVDVPDEVQQPNTSRADQVALRECLTEAFPNVDWHGYLRRVNQGHFAGLHQLITAIELAVETRYSALDVNGAERDIAPAEFDATTLSA